jgi:phospholipid N-methyltransferase
MNNKSQKQNILSFIKDYKVAAVASSSKFVVNSVMSEIPTGVKNVVEFGAGDGVVSKKLLDKMDGGGKLVLIEQSGEFVKILKNISDKRVVVVEGNAEDFDYEKYFAKEKVDLVLSSIPFTFLEKENREKIVIEAGKNLKAGGKIIIFHQYSLLMKDVVKKYFINVDFESILRNIPPCFILIGEKK